MRKSKAKALMVSLFKISNSRLHNGQKISFSIIGLRVSPQTVGLDKTKTQEIEMDRRD